MKYSYESLINFYKEINLYDELYFKEIDKRTKKIPHSLVGYDFYGVFPKINKDGLLYDFIICVPEIDDLDTFLVNVHEFAHGLVLLKSLNKVFKTNYMDELFPKSLERIYLNNHENDEVIKKYNKRDLEKYERTTSIAHKNAILLQFMVAKDYEEQGKICIPYKQELPDLKEQETIIKRMLICD